MKLKIGFSPCPNDTFIFDALVNGKIDTEGIEFEVVMADVEALNKQAFAGDIDITKLSYHAYAYLVKTYVLLDAGSALGKNCGPLLIAKRPLSDAEVNNGHIAIPGKFTTANFLFSLAFPEAGKKQEMVFSEIEGAVLGGKADAGLIIHENRFTYQQKGLIKIIDLGEFWESSTGLPIPLGGIVVKRSLPSEVKLLVNRLVAKSVRYALENPAGTKEFVRSHSQEMEDEIINEHIKLYVNDFTVSLGGSG
ncbi:MAG: 1,4-dihydroxy-6-naphthoate synthase, partial [Saprospiraceae bacterium]|nr:1,4-dihydroxy-6-naphthoate synthase [Saprospiraceae bacterium]